MRNVRKTEILRAAEVLRGGGLVAFPTETVYGLGADALNASAVTRIFEAKGRPADHPLIVHVSDAGKMQRFARDIPAVAWRLADRFWPGALTLILRRSPDVPDVVTGGQDTVGLRVPAHPVAVSLLKAFGGGVAAPSANPFGGVSPTTAAHVLTGVGWAADIVIDGGPCTLGLESTILDLSTDVPRILRPGPVTRDALVEVMGVPLARHGSAAPRVPGSLLSHYAPKTVLRLVDAPFLEWGELPRPLAVMALRPPPEKMALCHWVTMPRTPEAYGRALYARLRAMDSWACRLILVERPPSTREWEAVHDRLARAAGLGPPP